MDTQSQIDFQNLVLRIWRVSFMDNGRVSLKPSLLMGFVAVVLFCFVDGSLGEKASPWNGISARVSNLKLVRFYWMESWLGFNWLVQYVPSQGFQVPLSFDFPRYGVNYVEERRGDYASLLAFLAFGQSTTEDILSLTFLASLASNKYRTKSISDFDQEKLPTFRVLTLQLPCQFLISYSHKCWSFLIRIQK